MKTGDLVRVHYRVFTPDGAEYGSSLGKTPFEFILGSEQVLRGFSAAVAPLSVGERVTVLVPAADAYGERDEEFTHAFPRSAFPTDPQVGWVLEISLPQGGSTPAKIIEVDEENVVVDLNHPLVGQDLTFEIEVLEVIEH